MKRKIRIGRNVVLAFLCLILLSCVILFVVFHNEIITISSIKRINDIPVYEMNYRGDYAFDKYLMTGSKNYNEYTNFMNVNLLKGIPSFFYKNFECSTFFARTPEGDFIMARNYDTTITIPFVLKTNSNNGYKSIGMADLHNLGWNNTKLDR